MLENALGCMVNGWANHRLARRLRVHRGTISSLPRTPVSFAGPEVHRPKMTKPPDLVEGGRLLTIKNDYFVEKFSNLSPSLGSNPRSTVNSLSMPFESVPTPVIFSSVI